MGFQLEGVSALPPRAVAAAAATHAREALRARLHLVRGRSWGLGLGWG